MIEPRVLFGRLEEVIIPPIDIDAGFDGVDGQLSSLGLRAPMIDAIDVSWCQQAANYKSTNKPNYNVGLVVFLFPVVVLHMLHVFCCGLVVIFVMWWFGL